MHFMQVWWIICLILLKMELFWCIHWMNLHYVSQIGLVRNEQKYIVVFLSLLQTGDFFAGTGNFCCMTNIACLWQQISLAFGCQFNCMRQKSLVCRDCHRSASSLRQAQATEIACRCNKDHLSAVGFR
jgi:hypothetical protein